MKRLFIIILALLESGAFCSGGHCSGSLLGGYTGKNVPLLNFLIIYVPLSWFLIMIFLTWSQVIMRCKQSIVVKVYRIDSYGSMSRSVINVIIIFVSKLWKLALSLLADDCCLQSARIINLLIYLFCNIIVMAAFPWLEPQSRWHRLNHSIKPVLTHLICTLF